MRLTYVLSFCLFLSCAEPLPKTLPSEMAGALEDAEVMESAGDEAGTSVQPGGEDEVLHTPTPTPQDEVAPVWPEGCDAGPREG